MGVGVLQLSLLMYLLAQHHNLLHPYSTLITHDQAAVVPVLPPVPAAPPLL
jgi:hypothetical protein